MLVNKIFNGFSSVPVLNFWDFFMKIFLCSKRQSDFVFQIHVNYLHERVKHKNRRRNYFRSNECNVKCNFG